MAPEALGTIETTLGAAEGRPLRIGLIADTHVHAGQIRFPEAALAALRGVDQIVHLGDMGQASALDRLAEAAPVVATRGGDAVAFAGTHAPELYERDAVPFVNPGSATLPASGARTVAILELGAAPPCARVVEP